MAPGPAWTAPAVEPAPESTRLTIRLTRRARARLAKVRRASVELALESRVGKGTTRLKLRR